MEMKPLSKETCAEIAEWGDKVIRDAVKYNKFVADSVYEAPEVLQARINYTVGQIVNFALTKAHEEWSEDEEVEDSCAYCLEYEHGMKPATKCTCAHHCGAMVCPKRFVSKKVKDTSCLHAPYGNTPYCAVIDCANYAGKKVR